MERLKKLEVVSVSALTILFLVLALLNLGSLSIPSSCWVPGGTSGDNQIIFDFGSVQRVKEVYVFFGDEKRNKFDIYGGEAGEWQLLSSYDRANYCSWEKIKLQNTSTRFLKFVFDAYESKGEIGEVLVISGEDERIEPIRVYAEGESDSTSTSGEDVERLIDEQEILEIPVIQLYKYGTYFDEVYFVRAAHDYLNLREPPEVHPPLGKLIIAGGIACFGMNPFGWRILGVLAATAMIPLMFLLGKRMFKSTMAGLFAASLLTFDFAHFTLSRLATGETYIALFSLMMFYFFFDYVRMVNDGEGGKEAERSLFISVICFGLWFATKWTAAFGLAAILILWLISNLRNNYSDYRIILAGLLVSAAIYIAAYIPYMLSGTGHGLRDVVMKQFGIFGYHAWYVVGARHPFSSPWWSWPLMLKPLWLYSNTVNSTVSTIVLMGNPAIWWGGIPALILIGAKFLRDAVKSSVGVQDYLCLFILIPFILLWLPYALITRILFIYHFVPAVPFMILAITYWMNELQEKASKGEFIAVITVILILTAVLFCIFYPVISGYPVAIEYKESLRWLEGWIF
ncbi:MAG: phospholipid carrier-dependent glycosyltransferase [Candidatus Methanospirareceae archaeon]